MHDITWSVKDILRRSDEVRLYRDYYDGNHAIPWASPNWRKKFWDLFHEFRDNLCPAVIDAKADRIQLAGITAGVDEVAVNDAISAIWQRERLEARQGEITKNALKDGDAFIIVWPDESNRARWYIQRGDRMAIRYAEEPQGTLQMAAKLWPVEDHADRTRWRINLYYADRIERHITTNEIAGGEVPEDPARWEPFVPASPGEDTDEGPPNLSSIVPNPYGMVPVFPFPNNGDTGAYGRSDLKDIIPLQNALNKSMANMLVAGEFVAWPQRYIIGLEVDVDEHGRPTGSEQNAAMNHILAIGNPNAKAGTFEGADLRSFIAEQDSLRGEIARVSRTPLHYLLLSGDFPSGEALDAAEEPMVAAVNDRILGMRPVWQAAMSFSLTIEGVEHDPTVLDAVFLPTRRINHTARAEDMRMKKELGIPDEQLWREMGYDEEQIRQFSVMKAERRVAMQASFDAGVADAVNVEGVEDTPVEPLVL